MWKSDISISDTGCNEFGDSWKEGQETDHRSRQGGSSFRKRISMFIFMDTRMTVDPLEGKNDTVRK